MMTKPIRIECSGMLAVDWSEHGIYIGNHSLADSIRRAGIEEKLGCEDIGQCRLVLEIEKVDDGKQVDGSPA